MSRVELPPLPKPDGVIISGVDGLHAWRADAMVDYGIACARTALDAALRACNETQILVAGHPWTALQAQSRIGDAIRALSIEQEKR